MTPLPSGFDVDALMQGWQLIWAVGLVIAAPFAGWSVLRRITGE